MDTTWFAVDAQGQVAHFSTYENGAVPRAWLGDVDTAYDLVDELFAHDVRARYLRGELKAHPTRAVPAFVVTSDPSVLLEDGGVLLVNASPAVVLVETHPLRKTYRKRKGVLASVAIPRAPDLASLGVFQYEHEGAPGSYVCVSTPSAPLEVDELPFGTRDALTHVTFETRFGAPFQLADHTKAASYWNMGGQSLRGGEPEADPVAKPLSPVLKWLGDDALPGDTRQVNAPHLALPVITTLLALEGLTLDDLAEATAREIDQIIASLRGEKGEPRAPRRGVALAESQAQSLRAHVHAIAVRVASFRSADLQFMMACRYAASLPDVSPEKLAFTLRADLESGAVLALLNAVPIALDTVYYSSPLLEVVLGREPRGGGFLYREGQALVRGPLEELLAMLDEPHFSGATDAVMRAKTTLYRVTHE